MHRMKENERNIQILESEQYESAEVLHHKLITSSNEEWKCAVLLSFYGCVPRNLSFSPYLSATLFIWFAISKFALFAVLVYTFAQWVVYLHSVDDSGAALLMSIAYAGTFASAFVFIVPYWYPFLDPYLNGLIDSKIQETENPFQYVTSKISLTENQLAKRNALYLSFLLFIIMTVFVEVSVIIDASLLYQTTLIKFAPRAFPPIIGIGEFFVGCAQAAYVAMFLYHVLLAEHLVSNFRLKEEKLLSDLEVLRDDFNRLFGDYNSNKYIFNSSVILVGFFSVITGIVRVYITPSFIGFLNALCFYGKNIVFAAIIFRYAGHLNTKCDELQSELSRINPKRDIEQILIAINLQAAPLSVSYFGFRPTRSMYTWQLFGVTLTFGLRLLHGLAGM